MGKSSTSKSSLKRNTSLSRAISKTGIKKKESKSNNTQLRKALSNELNKSISCPALDKSNIEQDFDSPVKLCCSTPIGKHSSELNNNKSNGSHLITIDETFGTTSGNHFLNSSDSVVTVIENKSVLKDTVVNVSVVELSSTLANDGSVGSSDSTVTVTGHDDGELEARILDNVKKMNSKQKNVLIEKVVKKLFDGRKVAKKYTSITNMMKNLSNDFIIMKPLSRSSIGSNIYRINGNSSHRVLSLRPIVIDGSNVAMSYTKGRFFSVDALKCCIEYFTRRGHEVKAFVPEYRGEAGKSSDFELMQQLANQGLVEFTHCGERAGRTYTSYDDRFIVQYAMKTNSIIISNDKYRDLYHHGSNWRVYIQGNTLGFTWVNKILMFPVDPLGRYGPTLQEFLTNNKP